MATRAVELVEHHWIPLADGTRLAARIWLPADAYEHPVPAILEYLPYRLSDGTATSDHAQMTYFAERGYAGVRVDIRGSGNSDGTPMDEYVAQEQADALEVVRWLAAEPWCDGGVGMIGASWGGFNGLQVAAEAPPELKAVVTYFASDDRYADDVHYRGGCVLGMDMLHWSVSMLSFLAQPPLPWVVGDDWRERWLERLATLRPLGETWLAHQRRDAYWRHGSVCEDYRAIRAPVLAIGGWTDGYTDAVLRLLHGLEVPRRGIIGPWGHNGTEDGVPGPGAGVLREVVRWYDRWLKGEQNGADDEPMLTAYLQDRIVPAARCAVRPGRWVTERVWPSPDVVERTLALPGGGVIRGLQQCGLDSGAWCADGASDDLPPDQRGEDGMSVCVESDPLDGVAELLGFARVSFTVESDEPLALAAVRLCDVGPDGTSLLVTRGLLNLAQRSSRADPERLVPGRPERVTVVLDSIGHRFGVGRRLRVGISPTYWPLAWPSPRPATLRISDVELELPLRTRTDEVAQPFGPPEFPARLEAEAVTVGTGSRRIERDLARGAATLVFDWDMGGRRRLVESRIECEDTSTARYTIVEGDPLSAHVEVVNTSAVGRGGWQTVARVRGEMTCDAVAFHLVHELTVREGADEVFARTYRARIPRDHV
jgi:predicted acyl esterase